MEVENKKQRSGSLKGFFLRFLFSVGISVVAVIMIYVLFIGVGFYHGFLLPANAFSNIVYEYENTLKSGGTISLEEIPREISYAVFDSYGEMKKTTFKEEKIEEVKDLIQDKSVIKKDSSFNLQKKFHVVRTGENIYVFEYYITAEFASPVLRRLFPHVEWALILFMIFLILADIFLVSIVFARRLSKKVDYMKQAADKIKDRQLTFHMKSTAIKEFDSVMLSLDELKENLSESLSIQWEMEQQKKEQIGALAHDIKTPLTIIRGNSELLLETELSEEQKNYALYISSNVLRIQKYVKSLIELSKGKVENVKLQNVKVTEFLGKIEAQFLPLLKGKNLKLQCEHRILVENVCIDLEMCTRALMNLVDNAVQYSPESGTIYFNVVEETEYICFSIEDEGVGFSKEDLRCATREFYRADQNRNMDGHYGMGLFIAKQIAAMHEGNIQLENGITGAKVIFKVKWNVSKKGR